MAKKLTKKTAQPTSKRVARSTRPKAEPRADVDADVVIRRDADSGKIWSHIRQKWLVETPEEQVRQSYLPILINEYGFSLDQMEEELNLTGRGSANARADFVIWRTAQDRSDRAAPLIVVECKSDNVTIQPEDYGQGDAYARIVDARFVVTHNSRETKYWRVRKDKMPGYLEEIENIPHANASDADIEKLLLRLKTFKEDEFADLLHSCHNVIRNREHLDPTAAFDEIAKVLFVKTWVEREMKRKRQRKNLFSAEFLDEQISDHPVNELFRQTKTAFADDHLFADDDRVNLKPDTAREIVRLLERYNLSDTSEDVKGIAFERFLGRTFRGEIGQFFTPRSIVEFMIRMVEPKEGEVICDPASGSGGFLIRFFEIVREQILQDVDRDYAKFVASLDTKKLSESKRAEKLREQDEQRRAAIDQADENSRLWHLANRCIYGCDANDRMARTSKMNMIMHGDGHGGVHHHNGFINVNGIFEGRFDIILTNPPFGATVAPTDRITEGDLRTTEEQRRRYTRAYGDAYKAAQERVKNALAARKPIGELFELPFRGDENRKLGKIKTEVLFIERCLALLKPGGRLGIVLPEGIFNNPSLQYVREFCEDRARILAVVSLPEEAFNAAGATVKASLLFVQKFTDKESVEYAETHAAAVAEVEAKYADEIAAETERLESEIAEAKKARDADRRKAAQAGLRAYEKRMADLKTAEARALLRERFDYPIFLYDAKHIGITATGEPDTCELYADDTLGLPDGASSETTALGQYRQFCQDPQRFLDVVEAREATV
ncbi:MAG: N-6 DNA methylase [Phycisphaeraceae bacterium]|nr:N-6 DNA methylase [Phycisphaeraceae bacterium]